jgi:hypothetical protein
MLKRKRQQQRNPALSGFGGRLRSARPPLSFGTHLFALRHNAINLSHNQVELMPVCLIARLLE